MDSDQEALKCSQKLRFPVKKDAQMAAVVAAHQHGIKLKPYRCRHCDWWHLASA